MKKIIEISDRSHVIITYYMHPMRDEKGNFIVTNPTSNFGPHKGLVSSIELLTRKSSEDGSAYYAITNISENALHTIMKEVKEIRDLRSEEFIEP